MRSMILAAALLVQPHQQTSQPVALRRDDPLLLRQRSTGCTETEHMPVAILPSADKMPHLEVDAAGSAPMPIAYVRSCYLSDSRSDAALKLLSK